MISIISGIVGFILLLFAHILILFKVIEQESFAFNLYNFVGAILLVIYVNEAGYLSITVLPGLWALISLFYMLHPYDKGHKDIKKNRWKKVVN